MIRFIFRQTEASETLKYLADIGLGKIFQRHKRLGLRNVSVTFLTVNSPRNPGPDLYQTKIHIPEGLAGEIIVIKEGDSFPVSLGKALSALDGLLREERNL